MAYYPHAQTLNARYVLTSPEGATAVFNDPEDPNYVGALTEISGLDSAEVRETSDDLVQQDGGMHGDFWLGRRPITMNGKIFGFSTELERRLRMDRLTRASMALRGDATLSWKPAKRVENLVPNPSAESTELPWVPNASAVPVSRSTTWASSGSASFRVNGTTAAGSTYPGITLPTANLIPVVPGRHYGIRATVNAITVPGTSNGTTALIRFFDAANTLIGTSTDIGQNQSTSTGVKNFVAAGTAPANAAKAMPIVYIHANAASAVDFYVDSVLIAPLTGPSAAAVPAYFDGSMTGYHWQGDAHASASGDFIEMFTPVRRQQPLRTSGGWIKDFQLQLVSEWATLFSTTQRGVGGTGVVAENRGSYPAFPIFRIDGPAVNTVITVTGAGTGALRTTLNLSAGEYVTVDAYAHTATKNDGSNMNRYIDYVNTTTWPILRTGNNTITRTGTGTITTYWRDTWA